MSTFTMNSVELKERIHNAKMYYLIKRKNALLEEAHKMCEDNKIIKSFKNILGLKQKEITKKDINKKIKLIHNGVKNHNVFTVIENLRLYIKIYNEYDEVKDSLKKLSFIAKYSENVNVDEKYFDILGIGLGIDLIEFNKK